MTISKSEVSKKIKYVKKKKKVIGNTILYIKSGKLGNVIV